jgi:ATP-binding cassette subfamily A (ABC1) protein 3
MFTGGYPNWDYTLRLNQSYDNFNSRYPLTSDPNLDISIKSSRGDTNLPGYVDSNTFSLSDYVNSYVATETCQRNPSSSNLKNICGKNETVVARLEGVAKFPNEKYKVAGFWSQIGFIFGLLLIVAFCLPVANMIASLVQEKETKMRETMMMMALRSDALWLSWIFHFICLFLPLAILLTLAGGLLFQYSSGSYVFIYFMTFFLASISYAIFISTMFNKSRSAAVVGCLFYFAGYIIYVGE